MCRTRKYIVGMYKEYDGSLPEVNNCLRGGDKVSEQHEDEDDFLMDHSPTTNSIFTYSTSPGFMQG